MIDTSQFKYSLILHHLLRTKKENKEKAYRQGKDREKRQGGGNPKIKKRYCDACEEKGVLATLSLLAFLVFFLLSKIRSNRDTAYMIDCMRKKYGSTK